MITTKHYKAFFLSPMKRPKTFKHLSLASKLQINLIFMIKFAAYLVRDPFRCCHHGLASALPGNIIPRRKGLQGTNTRALASSSVMKNIEEPERPLSVMKRPNNFEYLSLACLSSLVSYLYIRLEHTLWSLSVMWRPKKLEHFSLACISNLI
jgi:hypothetical protein